MGQIQKVAFQRVYSSGTTKNTFVEATSPIDTLANWTTFQGASDSTKVTVSPFIDNPESEPGAAREYGGGNATVGGVPLILGSEPTPFTCELLQKKQSIIDALKDYMCESQVKNLGVYLFDEFGQIGCLVDDIATPANYYPIPIWSFFVSDLGFGGFESPDRNLMQWMFPPNWSDLFTVITPADFDPLTDL